MILRQLTKHVKDQNWVAVGLDFVIVVLGVFIGLQVQQWAVERDRQRGESDYLVRLHREVMQLLEIRTRYDNTRSTFSADMISSVQGLTSGAAEFVLSEAQCNAFAGSSHTTVPPVDLPTIIELLSTGRLDLITSQEVRTTILNLTQNSASARELIDVISEETYDLGRAFPHVMTYKFGASPFGIDQYWLSPDCSTEAMRNDPAFMNALIDNTYMYNVYTERAVRPVSQRVRELHEVLDEALGIQHKDSDGVAP